MVVTRMSWPLPGREGWFLELGPVPDRKSTYLVLGGPHGMHSLAQVLGANEDGSLAESLADVLDQLTAVPYRQRVPRDTTTNNKHDYQSPVDRSPKTLDGHWKGPL